MGLTYHNHIISITQKMLKPTCVQTLQEPTRIEATTAGTITSSSGISFLRGPTHLEHHEQLLDSDGPVDAARDGPHVGGGQVRGILAQHRLVLVRLLQRGAVERHVEGLCELQVLQAVRDGGRGHDEELASVLGRDLQTHGQTDTHTSCRVSNTQSEEAIQIQAVRRKRRRESTLRKRTSSVCKIWLENLSG